MKAVVYEKHGPSDVLQPKEVERPVPKDNKTLVRVFTTTVTATIQVRMPHRELKWDIPNNLNQLLEV